MGWLYVDADLYNIHQDSGWKAYKQILLQKSNIIEPVTRPDLKAIVLDIYEDDQKDRQYAVNNHNLTKEENEKLFNRIKELEKITKVKVANLLNTYGWLTKTMVGTEASEAITFVLIHSDSLPLQIKYLPVLKKAYKKGEAKGMLYAMLKDRIAVIKKIPQAYGSQISYEGGKPHLYKLKKPAGVDKRRKKMGMSLLNDYLKNWKLKWPE